MNLPPRFILYRRTWDAQNGKWQKIPCDEYGRNINAHDPKNWRGHADVVPFAKWDETRPDKPYGIGWVLNGEGYFFIDIDDGKDTTGAWKPDVEKLFLGFAGALGELSTSGNGLHIIGRCDPSRLQVLRNKWNGDREFYTDKRFVALSKDGLVPIKYEANDRDWTDHLLHVVPHREKDTGSLREGRDGGYDGPEDDNELLELMLKSCSASAAFGGVRFSDLWRANGCKLGAKYPDDKRAFDHSAADAALAQHLAFWTGRDAQRMERLFRRSGLMRDKWESRPDYRARTIRNAIKLCKSVYSKPKTTADENPVLHPDMSHDELAIHIFKQFWAGEMLYIPEEDRWVEWNGQRWARATTKNDQITRLRRDLRRIPDSGDTSKRKRLGDQKTVMAVNAFMKTNEGATRRLLKWDEDPFLLGTPRCIVDLKTGQIRPRRHDDYLLCSTKFDPSPVASEPVVWLEFLNSISEGNTEVIEFLQRLSGYAATGSTKEHKLFFAYGAGRNGKSTWLNTLVEIFSNEYARVISPKLLLDKKTEQHATDLAYLSNARLARASEIPVGKSWDEVLVKQITGGDPITARYMRQDNFTFKPQCTLIVDANNAPSIRGIDEAMRRRMCVIPFKVTIPVEEVDPNLSDKLLEEGPAILRWIITGAVNWHRDGLKIPKVVQASTTDYLEAEDTLGTFLKERFSDDPNGRVCNLELHSMFQTFLMSQGLGTWSKASLSKEMKKRGYQSYRSGSERGFKGLRPNRGLPSASFP